MMKSNNIESKIFILTEDANRNMYSLEIDDYNEIVSDWLLHSRREFIPADNARVFFASYNGNPINPYSYRDFASLTQHIRTLLF